MRNRGQQTERDILKKIGARRQPGSGAISGFPNDGVKGRYLIEVKSTQCESLSLKRKWLEDLEENAITRGKTPALIVIFNWPTHIQGSHIKLIPCPSRSSEWVAIPRRDFDRLTKGWKRI